MAKASTTPSSIIPVNSDADTKTFATKVFTKSDYPKAIKENFKLVLNLFINFGC